MARNSRPPLTWSVESQAVHAGESGYRLAPASTSTPIFMTSSFHYDTADELERVLANEEPGFVYTRYGNPTTRAFETAVAQLEHTDDALAFSSGMAAIFAALALCVSAGTTVVASRDIYGASFSVLRDHFQKLGVTPLFVDITDLKEVASSVAQHQPCAILAETISNPLLRVADIRALAKIAHASDAKLLIDNTFATPLLVMPCELGADMSIHSSTKYIGGHGDLTGGVIAASADLIAGLREQSKMLGAIPSPMDAWLSLRGIKTLPLRFERQCTSAKIIADALREDSRFANVLYPDHGSAPEGQFLTAHRGAMVSFEVKHADREKVFRLLSELKLVVPATTLGDVFSLMLYPAMASHRALTPEERQSIGISDQLVRLSVGIESPRDILEDVRQAVSRALE